MIAPPPPSYHHAITMVHTAAQRGSFSSLEPHLVHNINSRLPLYDLLVSTRLVNRLLYTFAMERLRREVRGAWEQQIGLKPFSESTAAYSIPPPLPPAYDALSSSSSSSAIKPRRDPLAPPPDQEEEGHNTRELAVLDLFLAVTIIQSQLREESDLYGCLRDEDVVRDLFEFMRPKARLEDLVIAALSKSARSSSPKEWIAIEPKDVTIALTVSRMKASVSLPFQSASGVGGVKKTVVECETGKGSSLEALAEMCATELRTVSVRKRRNGFYEWI